MICRQTFLLFCVCKKWEISWSGSKCITMTLMEMEAIFMTCRLDPTKLKYCSIFAFYYSIDNMSRWNCLMMQVIVHFCRIQSSLAHKRGKFLMALEIVHIRHTHNQRRNAWNLQNCTETFLRMIWSIPNAAPGKLNVLTGDLNTVILIWCSPISFVPVWETNMSIGHF